MSDPKSLLEQLKKQQPQLRDALPDVMKHFFGLLQSAEKDGALSHKTKELVTLGIAVALRCDYCIAVHVDYCLKAGATRDEILEVCGVAIAMGGGPAYTYTTFAMDCLDALSLQA